MMPSGQMEPWPLVLCSVCKSCRSVLRTCFQLNDTLITFLWMPFLSSEEETAGQATVNPRFIPLSPFLSFPIHVLLRFWLPICIVSFPGQRPAPRAPLPGCPAGAPGWLASVVVGESLALGIPGLDGSLSFLPFPLFLLLPFLPFPLHVS